MILMHTGISLKCFTVAVCSFLAAESLISSPVLIRQTNNDGTVSERKIDSRELGGGLERITIKKESLADVAYVDVIPDFARAKKGDDGYWVDGRGWYGRFDRDNGEFCYIRSFMPIFGMKKADKTFWAVVKTYRFNYDFRVDVKDGNYAVYPRFRIDNVRKFFEPYDDIVVEYRALEGDDANYSGMARGYRNYRIARGEITPIKERVKKYPELDYLCDSIVVRIQTHGAKPIPETDITYTKETEQPIIAHMPFGVSEEFVQAIKDSGVDKCTIVSAGWNNGGYDGRTPSHFPVEITFGGEEAFRRLIRKTQDLGFQFTLHATNTDAYPVSPMWSPSYISKWRDGSLVKGGVWAGGQCFMVCQRAAWNGWTPKELEQMRDLGARGPHYIDVFSSLYPTPCADPNHLATPEITAEYQNKILARSKELFGSAASEAGFDHVAGNIDYINYIGGALKVLREHRENKLIDGLFPLWEIVYHGIVMYNSDRETQNHTRGKCPYKLDKSGDPRWMEGDGKVDPFVSLKIVEFGGKPIFYTYKFADVPRIKKAWDEFVPVRRLQRELMQSHEEIAKDVFLVKYEDGSRVVANYNKTPFKFEGVEIPAIGYKLFEPNK